VRSLNLKGCGFDEELPVANLSGAAMSLEGVFSFVSTDAMGWTWVTVDGITMRFRSFRTSKTSHSSDSDGRLLSPMPGSVVAIHVEPGDVVAKGDAILTIEAMKMEQTLASPIDGVVEAVNVALGNSIDAGFEAAQVIYSDRFSN